MLGIRLDSDLEWVLDHDVDDLARYNILRYLHDNPHVLGDVAYFSDQLGLRDLDRTGEALEALARRGLLEKVLEDADSAPSFRLCHDPDNRGLVDRLYRLSSTSDYGEIVERLAARSLHRARKALAAARGHRNGHAK